MVILGQVLVNKLEKGGLALRLWLPIGYILIYYSAEIVNL